MSTKSLVLSNAKPYTASMDGKKNIYQVGEIMAEDVTVSCVPPSSLTPSSITRCSLTWSRNDNNCIVDEIYFQALATNSHASDDNLFFNNYLRFSQIKVFINGTEVYFLKDQQSIICKVSDFCRKHGEADITQALMKFVQNTTPTSGDSNAANSASTLSVELPLLSVLFPELKGFVVNALIQRLEFEFTFTPNYASTGTVGIFSKSSSTNNSYASVSYGSVALRQQLVRCYDARLLKTVSNKILLKKYIVKSYSVDAGTADTRMAIISLKNDFSTLNKMLGCYIFLQSPSVVTAYNDSDCAKQFSKITNIGWKLLHNSKVLLDYSASSADLKKRRDYQDDFNWRRYGVRPHKTLLTAGDSIPEYFSIATYIDLQSIDVFDESDELIGGISNNSQNIEIHPYVGSTTVHATSTLYCCVEYLELANFDKDGNITIIR